jgi:hypothetical protein
MAVTVRLLPRLKKPGFPPAAPRKTENKVYERGGKNMEKNFDPYDMEKKRQLHPKADEKNFMDIRKGNLVLRCGGMNRNGEPCKSIAGAGTNHTGYGRCKFCGGSSTGPKTEEGKQKVSQNSRKHGLYARYLTEEEQATYEELKEKKDITLSEEISFLKTKLTSYLRYVQELESRKGKKGLIRYRYRGESVSKYEMGSIEDPNVHKTLEQIRRLVATAKAIDETTEHGLLSEINEELRAAGQIEIKALWGSREAQQRITENE